MPRPCKAASTANGHASKAGSPLASTDTGASKLKADSAHAQAGEGRQS